MRCQDVNVPESIKKVYNEEQMMEIALGVVIMVWPLLVVLTVLASLGWIVLALLAGLGWVGTCLRRVAVRAVQTVWDS